MEIAESTSGIYNNKKQMSETLTTAKSTEDSGKNNNNHTSVSCSSANSATTITTLEARTKDKNTTAMNTAGASDTTNKDMDIEIIDIPSSKIIATGEYTKNKIDCKDKQLKQQPHSSKLITSDTGGIITLDDDIPIISISDGEDCVAPTTQTAQKVNRKRNSFGGSASLTLEEEQFRKKRRKIKVAGAPKMPLTGYVRYMNERRETLRKELPTKTAIEHTKIIGEEWQKITDDKKAPYMKAAELDKKRYLDELHIFLKDHPDVLASELAKGKQARKSSVDAGKVVLKEKSQSIGNIKSPNKETNAITTVVSKDKIHPGAEKDNSPTTQQPQRRAPPTLPTPAAEITTTTTSLDNKNRRKRTPTPPNGGSTNNSNNSKTRTITNSNASNSSSNNNNNNHNSNTTNSQNSNSNVGTTTLTTANIANSLLAASVAPGEIPIFTNEFLEHNKILDMELRTLRKSKTDLEQQNAVLEKHVENMKFGVEKMTNENDELAEKNRLLELYLDKLKSKLAHALSGLAIPSQPNGATMDNIEKYMCDLYKMATTNTHGPASLNKAKDIIRKLDLQINL